MRNSISDFQISFHDAYRNNSISTDETFQLSALVRIMENYAPKMTQTKMYELIYDMYIEEQEQILNHCLEMISGWKPNGKFEFLEE